jgi:AcrR family transcriptional regulator
LQQVTGAEGPAGVTQRDRILDIVVDLLETEGYDAVQLREVARRARTSLAAMS